MWNIYLFPTSYRETSFIYFYTFLISLSLEAKFFFVLSSDNFSAAYSFRFR